MDEDLRPHRWKMGSLAQTISSPHQWSACPGTVPRVLRVLPDLIFPKTQDRGIIIAPIL